MSSGIGPSPPWFVTGPDRQIRVLEIPDRLLHHPDLQRRGITLERPIKPVRQASFVFAPSRYPPLIPVDKGAVFSTFPETHPAYVVKILDPNTEEVVIQERLLRDIKRPNNHTLPSEITATGHPLLIMPMIGLMKDMPGAWSSCDLLDIIFQIVEGIEFLHSRHIVHMDMCMGNVLAGTPFTYLHPLPQGVVARRIYIIDFGISKQFALGPGVQPAITLPEAQIIPPNGLRHFDPYSWDVHCIGRTMEYLLRYRSLVMGQPVPPWIVQRYIQWLVGNERGCTGVCHCRPTARTALRVIVVLRWAFRAAESYAWVVHSLSRLWTSPT